MSKCRRYRRAAGFTLVEIAIVLLIIGLILGGVFKGQALIDSARVRAIHTELTGFQTAWLSFADRYRAAPGDFARADVQIDSAATPGNGNGRLDSSSERAGVWQQLALAGFISGSYDGSAANIGSAGDLECASTTCPKNPFNGFYTFAHGTQGVGFTTAANELSTGNQMPVNILSQLDVRLDDGVATTGRFRVHRDYENACTRQGNWDASSVNANCAAVLRD
ncbi:prepilin-type N-terminal cleavage/methylation domain-containing protein [Granulosicoccus sp. 3-233]|uniref:prepilin-type N-terminal cleavage/methylation domain-containing protein n=1 Tax=Granulosicoccus sp. 3-233 TaxID=3417969 RepID=UPI003D32498D